MTREDAAIDPSDNQEADPTDDEASEDISRVVDTQVDTAITIEQGPDNEQCTQECGMTCREREGFGLAPEQPAEPESDGKAVRRMA